MEEQLILAIESSCDETAAAVIKNGRNVLSNIISSQIALHTVYGGVVPEIASRKHIEAIDNVIVEAIKQANVTLQDIDAVAVTYGPGLVGALLVGLSEAKALAFALKKPLIGVHHIEGHICANYIENEEFKPPFVSLVVSGGHTHIVFVPEYGKYEIMGKTRDDAVGEAYDKVARAIGMGYPGGPKIDEAAKKGNSQAIDFPRVFLEENSYDFSFSGLKSAVLNYINKANMTGEKIVSEDVAASFQAAVIDVLVQKTLKAVKQKGVYTIALAGGVASNSALRQTMKQECDKKGYTLHIPEPIYCTDNAAMIGCAAYYEYQKGVRDAFDLNANPSLKLGER
ncbi:tRNA (adenosine(37)-N6)-threonylcarbamoyltransferase complex transferase subunit TsaD [Clostridium sp. MD294]|uniref:tRNA (adenosine(37)-N6)-threonylcarbamoyltransferase complex transferase subunit TsaD n=1 Tax=Clostridium sp. MD294 TaxID=97138 RepID=UPI0002CA1D1F|nr:tRNA (adenosine(37)-N6)-threonylcarbamoyltransferase complex transferase subunit TsaD [Clostridium sp. MD294]NDO46736.1 tRNA (adenosine(37)-N6)-threonylcarbamoyltransferase complex transferase subunit TsaD [Clostridium sp. MD294]USF28823.1 tRNA N6-adenosine threonylcarbamoyltransferase [Clostridium sp. MD294]